jgi:HEAT repeat protein
MLRDKNPQVRAHAAYLLGKTEYTAATRDLQVALETEENVETKKAIQTTLEQF